MSELKPFRVEVAVDATREEVWQALTEPTEIRRWFGWDASTLDDEIRYIFVDHARPHPPDRIELVDEAIGDEPGSHWIELEADGARTIVRAVRAGVEGAGPPDGYDDIEEGWRSFFEQLRHYLGRHAGEERRTVYLDGKAVAAELSAALRAKLPGEPWYEDRFQRGIATDQYGEGLVVLATRETLDSDRTGAVHITLTTHGLDDAAFAAAQDDWWAWWSAQVDDPEIVVG